MSLETRIAALATEIAARFNARKRTTVPLGRWEGTNVGSLIADNIFDDAIYSHYTIAGQFRPATDGANFTAVLRDATPSDVSGGLECGGYNVVTNGAGGNLVGNQSVLLAAVGSGAGEGVKRFALGLTMGDGDAHAFEAGMDYSHQNGNRFAAHRLGEFGDSTPRQGIKFHFSSGNITEGWIEIVGHLRQAP